MEQTFNRKHAEEILKPCGIDDYIIIDERGVWPKVEYDLMLQVETEQLRWRPAQVFQGEPGAPEAADTPMLPFPFGANELAAFMLEGVGVLVADFYGDWNDAPDPESLNEIDPGSNARTAIIQAFSAYREAKRSVGAYPLAPDAKADRLRKIYSDRNGEANKREKVFADGITSDESRTRRERAKASTAALKSKMYAATAKARTASEAWLKAMVKQLQPAPAQSPATPAPGVAASDTRSADLPLVILADGASDGLAWAVVRPVRFPGYRKPLYDELQAAHIAGKPCPTPRDVLDTWTLKPPPDVQVMPDGVKYNDGLGNPKEADLKAIGQAIKNLMK